MKLRTAREVFDKFGDDTKLWCSSWPPNMYFTATYMGKKYCIGNCQNDGFSGEEISLALDVFMPDIYFQPFKQKRKRPK